MLALRLALGIARSLQLESLTGRGRLGGLPGRRQIVTLNGGDQLPGAHVVAFVDGKGLDPARDARADDHFIGIYRADELQIVRALGREEIPAERDDERIPSRIKTRLRAFIRTFSKLEPSGFGHGHIGQDALGQPRAVSAVNEQALPRNCDRCLAPGFDGSRCRKGRTAASDASWAR